MNYTDVASRETELSSRSNSAVTPLFQVVVIAVLVFAVFSPGVFGEFSLVDDAEVVASLKASSHFSLKGILLPGIKEGGYYRPLLGLSQCLDRFAWQMNPRVVHIENIIFHVLNALWVFLLIRLYVPKEQRNTTFAPLLAASLFGLHPIVSESVNWYSGRTDLLAGNLVLPGLCALAAWRECRKNWLIACAFGLLLCSLLAKESVLAVFMALPLFFIPAHEDNGACYTNSKARLIFTLFLVPSLIIALCFFMFWPAVVLAFTCLFVLLLWDQQHRLQDGVSNPTYKEVLLPYAFLPLCLLLTCVVFFAMRHIAYSGRLPRIGATLVLMLQDKDYTIGLFLGALGFYIKKYFIALPLNFAIREIDPGYQLLGIIVMFIMMVLMLKRTRWVQFAMIGVVLLTPAMPFVFGTIAWTSYAERYMYLSTAFWSGAVALYVENNRNGVVLKRWVVTVCIVLFAALSCWRSIIWQTNVTLLADTVKKTPNFKDIRAFYMLALFLDKNFKAAEQQYHVASSLPSTIYNPRLDLVYAKMLQAQGKTDEYRNLIEKVIRNTKGASQEAVKALAELQQNEKGNLRK